VSEQFDLIVIGNGSAGDAIARTLGRQGKRVAVIERSHLGGECLNDGCVPSKALIHLSKRAECEGLPWDEIVARIQAVQLDVRGTDPGGGMATDGIELVWGDPEFVAPAVIRIGDRELTGHDIVVATGTEPGIPPIPGLADAAPLTNRTVFTMPERPDRLAVIGGGPIGLELGQAFRRLGSEVTIFEALERVALMEDAEVSLELTKALERRGVRIETRAAIECVTRDGGHVIISTERGTYVFDEVLVAAGRRPQIPRGLDELGLKLERRGFIDISGCGRTNLAGVWAAGDVTGKLQFTHYASYQAHHIGEHIMRGTCKPVPETLVPWAIFTDPEVGHAGLTEEQARASFCAVRSAVLRTEELDWFRTTEQTEGFVKVITEGDTGRLVGAHFVCAQASTLVGEACLAIQHRLTAADVASTVHAYPTASELFRWACARLA
jgi:pyruvate/2-oxoglutarate dehydrogenase complex dihydrolipoamide dehydrogenase (E3) component